MRKDVPAIEHVQPEFGEPFGNDKGDGDQENGMQIYYHFKA